MIAALALLLITPQLPAEPALLKNGEGVRTKTFLGIQVYRAALYLERKERDPAKILTSSGAWSLELTITHNVGRDRLLAELRDGISANTAWASVEEAFRPIEAALPDARDGQRLRFSYAPDRGTTFAAPGLTPVRVPGPALGRAVLRAYLGSAPLDPELRRALLGGP